MAGNLGDGQPLEGKERDVAFGRRQGPGLEMPLHHLMQLARRDADLPLQRGLALQEHPQIAHLKEDRQHQRQRDQRFGDQVGLFGGRPFFGQKIIYDVADEIPGAQDLRQDCQREGARLLRRGRGHCASIGHRAGV